MKNSPAIPIAYADDHDALRKSLARYLEDLGGISVLIETGDGAELIRHLERSEVQPSVCIIDIHMPAMDGFMLITEIQKRWPGMPVLVLTVFENESYIIRMIKLGARGYLLKRCKPEEIKEAIVSIQDTGYYYSETAGQRLFRQVLDGKLKNHDFNEIELALIRYSCTELSYVEIANELGTSRKSIEGYRDRLFQKLGINSRVSLALFAVQFGFVTLDTAHLSKTK